MRKNAILIHGKNISPRTAQKISNELLVSGCVTVYSESLLGLSNVVNLFLSLTKGNKFKVKCKSDEFSDYGSHAYIWELANLD